jgi:SAM-dependent methyltransferase
MKTWSMPVSNSKGELKPCILCASLGKNKNMFFEPSLECEGFSFVRCKKCGLVQRNPQPDKDEIINRYANTFGKDYLSYELENEAAFFNLQQLALKDAGFARIEKKLFNKSKEVPSILDIGCATGALLAYLGKNGWRVTGVEISPCANYAREERNLDVRSLPLEENHFPDSGFDVVLASHLVEHLNDPLSFFKDVYRILKNDGLVFITTPNISGFQARLFGSNWRSAIFDHLYLFSRYTLSKLLKNTGFIVESCNTWGGLAAGTVSVQLKKAADIFAKRFGFGDVMIIRARK